MTTSQHDSISQLQSGLATLRSLTLQSRCKKHRGCNQGVAIDNLSDNERNSNSRFTASSILKLFRSREKNTNYSQYFVILAPRLKIKILAYFLKFKRRKQPPS